MKTRHWIAGLSTLAAAALAGCGATAQPDSRPESAPADQEPAPVEAVSSGNEPAAVPPPQVPSAPTENYGPAPEITNETWLNTDTPIRLADQRGKVVLVEFWTFG